MGSQRDVTALAFDSELRTDVRLRYNRRLIPWLRGRRYPELVSRLPAADPMRQKLVASIVASSAMRARR